MKKLIDQSYEMGLRAFGKFKSAPYLNQEFMKTVPNCAMGDDKGCKLRAKMYKSYINGWTKEHVKSMGI